MKYTTRMILIPETEYLALKTTTSSKNIKKKKTTAIEIAQEMGKKIRQRDQVLAKSSESNAKAAVDIISFLPFQYHVKGRQLLDNLAQQDIRYNSEKEIILRSGQVVSHSNVVDILREALMPSKRDARNMPKPIGWREFMQDVISSSVPVTLFKRSLQPKIQNARVLPHYEQY